MAAAGTGAPMTDAQAEQLLQASDALFAAHFGGTTALRVWSPGRVNLIGEHIDYCGGTVLPMTIDRGIAIVLRANNSGRVRVVSGNAPEAIDVSVQVTAVDALLPEWGRYVVGVIALLADVGLYLHGADIALQGNLPTGGLSSSAALCVGLATGLQALTGVHLHGGRPALARLCQQVEHQYAGVRCGIMDQAVIALSEVDCALALRCADLTFVHVPAPTGAVSILVMDSGKPRRLADAPYNARQQQVRAAEAVLRERYGAQQACDLKEGRLAEAITLFDPETGRRVRHVVTEQRRVLTAMRALRERDWHAFGAAMTASHASLKDDFDVSCAELDCLVDSANEADGVFGARLTGAGFGGAAIALVETAALASARSHIATAFLARFGRQPALLEVRPGGCARVLAPA